MPVISDWISRYGQNKPSFTPMHPLTIVAANAMELRIEALGKN